MKLDINNYVDKKHITKIFLKQLIANIYNDLLNQNDEIDLESVLSAFKKYVSSDEEKLNLFLKEINELKPSIIKDIELSN